MRLPSTFITNLIKKNEIIDNGPIDEVISIAKIFNFDVQENASAELSKQKIKERFAKENISLDILKE